MNNYAIVLAAGKGTRMKTEIPKCAFPILKKPMIEYIYENIEKSIVDETVMVVGYRKDVIQDILKDKVKYAIQEEQLGTGHAVKATREYLEDKKGTSIIMLGDMPLIDTAIINQCIGYHLDRDNDLTVVTTDFNDPTGYGRILRDDNGLIQAIVEQVDATDEQKKIKEVNTGMYIVDNKLLF